MTFSSRNRSRWWSLTAAATATVLTTGCVRDTAPIRSAAAEAQLSGALASRDGEPSITIISPSDGEEVPATFIVEVDVSNVLLAPKGRTVDGEAHFHVLVDNGCLGPGVVIGDDDAVHVGTGAAKVELELKPGPHELCVQLGDGFHVAVAVADTIDIVVKADD